MKKFGLKIKSGERKEMNTEIYAADIAEAIRAVVPLISKNNRSIDAEIGG